jgi:N,N'-diacetylchitobiose phosphorylase
MQYGHFDDQRKEYIITNPATPASWSNYLGSTKYGAIITNNAGGYSFFKSAAQGRFMRFRTNTIPMDQPGRYIYIHDTDSKDYWSASWQPVGKPMDEYKSVCRHGAGYTIIESEYSGIKSETNYFVPLGKNFEYWHGKLTNTSGKKRKLRLFTFVEYSNHWVLYQDIVNLQYTQYILNMNVQDGVVEQGINVNLPPNSEDIVEEGVSRHSFLGVAGAKVTGYDTDRDKFLGGYRSYNNPIAVERGECSQSIAIGNNGCGTVQFDIELEAGETKEFVVVMGIGQVATLGKSAVAEAADLNLVKERFSELVNYWHGRLGNFTTNTPSPEFNSMINMWNPYNCLITFAWSRAASLVYAGERDGYGYRDTVQDMLGIIHILPEEAKERLELMITGQVSTGGAMPVVKFFDHKPGAMKAPDEKEYRSDDCMWLFNTIPAYVKETGDMDFYSKVLPYSDKGEDSVLNHMRRAIEFNLERSGAHGLPCGLLADWNDCLELGHGGETVFVAFQLYYALGVYSEIANKLGKQEESNWALANRTKLGENIEKHAWDGEWYLRAYSEKGKVFGSKDNEEGSIWLNPQTWAIISGHAQGDRITKILEKVKTRLATDYGIVICDPPYTKEDLTVIRAVLFNSSMKENGAIFCHTQGWVAMSEAINGNGTQAFNYYKSFMPASMNAKAEVREIEPYVYSQSTHGKLSPHHGASRLPWLTGAATWAYYSAMQHILGIRPEYDGLTIDPCIPNNWDGIKVSRVFRGKTLSIEIRNTNGVEKGVSHIELNGETISGNFIPIDTMKDVNTVVAYMGSK